MKTYEKLLNENNQTHILEYLKICNEDQRENLIKEIEAIDFSKLKKLYEISIGKNIKNKLENIKHLEYEDKYTLSKEFKTWLDDTANKVIINNEYAVVTMAGGQGTRLGHIGPKGTFKLDVNPKPKYLFEIIADSLKKYNKEYGIKLNWYIMTSSENNAQTVEFFKKNKYFNYPKECITFFIQGNMPLLDENGKLLIDENYHIKVAADGNGCIFKSMRESGILDDMRSKGIKWIFIGSVDNAILEMVDTTLLGLTIYQKNEIGSKSIVKRDASEKVGVFCKVDGVPKVIEYTEMPEKLANAVNAKGELFYSESHIMCNLFSIDALEKISKQELPYHSAHKKANYLNTNGEIVIVDKPNAYKYETFIFDGFAYFDNITIMRGKREIDFAPIKNKDGEDSPKTAINLYNKKFQKNT